MTTPRKVLGRGLSALIPQAPVPAVPIVPATTAMPGKREFFYAAIEDVHPTVDQPRRRFDEEALEALAQSIRKDGVLQPLLVRQREPKEGSGWALIAGERRWRAAQRAGLKVVPVVAKETTPRAAFELALVENLQREDLNPIEEALAYERLLGEHALSQEQLAERVGRDRSTIANSLRLLKLPPSVRTMVEGGDLSMGQARALLSLSESAAIERAARDVVSRQLSVRQVEALVKRAKSPAKVSTPAGASANLRDLEERLSRRLGTRAKVIDQGGHGRVEIAWGSLDELDRILDELLGSGA